jgi:hypothetical protein
VPQQVEGFGEMILMCSKDDGEYVKFSDIKELLQTSHNIARDEICGNDVCEYCAKHGKCFGTQHFPKCFVGRKLSPVA